ncbi:hypothetical protein EMMF5_003592 [Cystobasidiomycetes sp. EMM_F5]
MDDSKDESIYDTTTEVNDAEMERRILRKCDMRIIPLLCLSYLLNYLDRTNLGNARTLNSTAPDNMLTALGLDGNKYNTIVAIFYVPYVLFEFPSNIAMKYFTPSKWIARIMVSYTPSERGKRMAIFSASVAISGAFGGLIATGVSYMHGLANLSGWQWLFILEGIPAIIVGVVVYFYLPDYPETAKFLTPEEREFAAKRMGPHAPKGTDKHFDKADFFATIKAWQFWVFALQYFLMTNSLNAFGFFAPSIVLGLGFTGPTGQLLTVPPNAFAFFVIIFNSWSSDRFRERPRHIIAGLLFTGTGYLLLAVTTNLGARYTGLMLAACTNSAVIPFLAYRTATVTGATSTAFITAFLWKKLGSSSEYRSSNTMGVETK